MNIDETCQTRFWNKVDKRASNECWPWLGGHTPFGYGALWIDGRNHGAHRIAWMITNKGRVIPPGYQVCHHCDNPNCVNPRHLFVGTMLDNNNDKIRKGRAYRLPPANEHAAQMPRGSQHWNAVLTDEIVREIRTRLAAGQRQCDIMRAMNLRRGTITRIASNKHWLHVTS